MTATVGLRDEAVGFVAHFAEGPSHMVVDAPHRRHRWESGVLGRLRDGWVDDLDEGSPAEDPRKLKVRTRHLDRLWTVAAQGS